LIGLAQIAEARKDYEAMVRRLEEARSRNPKALEPALMLARYYLAKGDALRALEAARAIAESAPEDPSVLQVLGQAQLAAGETASAVAAFRKLVERSPKDPASHYLLGLALAASGDEEAALKSFAAALQLKQDFLPAAGEQIRLWLKQKRYEQALAAARKLQELLPKQPVGYVWEGEVALHQQQYQHALQAYQKAYALEGSSLTAQRLYQLYRQLGEAAKANAILEGWLDKAPQDPAAWLSLAMGYQADGERERAIAAYEKAQAVEPSNLLILNNLAWLYQERGDPKALQLAEQLVEKAKDHPEMLDTVGWIFSHHGKRQEGLTLLREAAVRAPHLPAIHLHLAEVLAESGNKKEAREILQRLLKEHPQFAERERAQALLDTL
jgi:putative PEP-CTERM system TPR-repeat lipoprotein